MGIGLDDMFVLLKAFEREDPSRSIEERLISAITSAGSSITVTTLTNVVAFSVGGVLPFPAIAEFCLFLALGVAFTMLYFTTFFVSCMVLDTQRQQTGGVDLIFRVFIKQESDLGSDDVATDEVKPPPQQQTRDLQRSPKSENTAAPKVATMMKTSSGDNYDSRDTLNQNTDTAEPKPDQLYLLLDTYWAPALMDNKLIWMAVYTSTMAIALYGLWTFEVCPYRQLFGLEAGTDMMEFYQRLHTSFSHRSLPVDLYLDASAGLEQEKLGALEDCLLSNEFLTGSVVSWLSVFELWKQAMTAAGATPQGTYDQQVKAFVTDQNFPSLFRNDILFSDNGGQITQSRIHAQYRGAIATTDSAQVGVDAVSERFPLCHPLKTGYSPLSQWQSRGPGVNGVSYRGNAWGRCFPFNRARTRLGWLAPLLSARNLRLIGLKFRSSTSHSSMGL